MDLPQLHQQCQKGREFIEALTETDNNDFFALQSVQVIIDHHYYFWYRINLYSIVLPAVVQVLAFWIWNNFILPIKLVDLELQELETVDQIDPETGAAKTFNAGGSYNMGDLNVVFQVILIMVSVYLLIYECTILIVTFYKYNEADSAPSNSLFVLSSIALTILILLQVTNADNDAIVTPEFWQSQSWVALAVWMRLILTYLGEIQQFGWLVGLIKYTSASTGYFLTVFLLSVTAFSDAFAALDKKIYINGDAFRAEELTEEQIKDAKAEGLSTDFKNFWDRWLLMWQISFRNSIGDF